MNDYDGWAVYYDLIHQGLSGEVEFYAGLAIPERLDTLELGCGTGRVALPLAMSGVRVTGLDYSWNMLCICAEKAREVGGLEGRLGLLQADMRDFALGRRFPLIIMPYRTFMHLLEPAEQVRCLMRVREHLAPGGRFVLNLWAARPSQIGDAMRRDATPLFAGEHDGGDGIRVMHFHGARYEEHRQRMVEVHRIEEHDPEGRVVECVELPLERTWFTVREMEHLVHRCGFEVVDLLGDFEGGVFGPESSEMIWVLRGA